MRLDRFDLNLLVVLDTLLEERNVTRASERLHIGQSAASGALGRLREYFGDELLMPVGRQLVLTPLAESLIGPVRDTLLQARATIARKPEFDPATAQRRFQVCVSDYVTTVMLARALERIAERAPGVTIDIRSHAPDVFDVFDRGGIDLLILPEQYADRIQHPRTKWFSDEPACIVWTGNQSVPGDELSFDTYMAMSHVAVRFGDDRSLTYEDWFLPRYGKQRRVDVTVDNYSTTALLVVGTQRLATVYRRLAEHFAQSMPLRIVRPPFDMPPLVEMMFWPRHLDQDPAHAWFRAVLQESSRDTI